MKRPSFLVKIVFALLVFQSHSAFADLTEDDLKLMPATKIIEFAKMGDPIAQYWLGNVVAHGAIENSHEYRFASDWWEKAAKQGHAHAAYKVGRNYISGMRFHIEKGLIEDPEKGSIYLVQAANAGIKEANFLLFQYYEANDEKLAFYHLKIAAESGLMQALRWLADAMKYGTNLDVIKQDKELALSLYRKILQGQPNQFESKKDVTA